MVIYSATASTGTNPSPEQFQKHPDQSRYLKNWCIGMELRYEGIAYGDFQCRRPSGDSHQRDRGNNPYSVKVAEESNHALRAKISIHSKHTQAHLLPGVRGLRSTYFFSATECGDSGWSSMSACLLESMLN